MAWIVEARDPYTGGHLWRVSRFSRLLVAAAYASRAGFTQARGWVLPLLPDWWVSLTVAI